MSTSHLTAAERVADQTVLFSGLDHDDDLVAECAASGVVLAEGEHWIDYVEAARERLDGVAEHALLTPRGL